MDLVGRGEPMLKVKICMLNIRIESTNFNIVSPLEYLRLYFLVSVWFAWFVSMAAL